MVNSAPQKASPFAAVNSRPAVTSTSSSVKRKRISFDRSGPSVTIVPAPRKEEHSDLWFSESDRVVSKPLVFDIPPREKISISIGMSVQFTAIGCCSAEPEGGGGGGGVEVESSKSGSGVKRVTLLVCDNSKQQFRDSLDDRLAQLLQQQESRNSNNKGGGPREQWFSCGTVNRGATARISVVLPAGEYILKCVGGGPLTVFGQATDVERHLA